MLFSLEIDLIHKLLSEREKERKAKLKINNNFGLKFVNYGATKKKVMMILETIAITFQSNQIKYFWNSFKYFQTLSEIL